jgi:hypothetical protein
VVNATPRPLYLLERPGTHFVGGWVGLRAFLDKCGNTLLIEIRSPDLPALSDSLYRLTYPSSKTLMPLTIALNMEYMKMVVELVIYENLSRVPLKQNTSMEFCLEVLR